MAKTRTVREGQRYVQSECPQSRYVIWQVGAIKTGGVPVPHARLINVEDPLRGKTISCDTLTDPSFYRLLSDSAGPAARV